MGQVLVCSGCCCGRTDKGKPSIPVEWLKNNWKQAGLLKTIQLTFSGCLGPCDLTNVVSILTPQKQIWMGGITDHYQYEALLEWAKSSIEVGYLLDLPEILADHLFERFKTL
jgi:cobaltochelatase CobN